MIALIRLGTKVKLLKLIVIIINLYCISVLPYSDNINICGNWLRTISMEYGLNIAVLWTVDSYIKKCIH